jgi:hypothetical protein
MEPFLSHCPGRRECFKGHDSEKGVLASIRYRNTHDWVGTLRIFEQSPGGFVEIPPAEWAGRFGEGPRD